MMNRVAGALVGAATQFASASMLPLLAEIKRLNLFCNS